MFAWLQAALRDKIGWKTIGYLGAKTLWTLFNVWFAISVWWDVFACLGYPLFGRGETRPAIYGVTYNMLHPGFFSIGSQGFIHGAFIMATGVALFFLAPWPMRLAVYVDRRLIHWLLGPDAVALRMRNLEAARASTVDASAALVRRIERDLHDGTQAQLVALAMRLGDAKERLDSYPAPELAPVRQLLDEAHRGAKEAIVELRDLARGIHPPALDVGLEGALSTLAARSTVQTELAVSITDRPTPAIESIAYFCVAELLANVAQHAQASRATVICSQTGTWLRLVVRDDGTGGAVIRTGSARQRAVGAGRTSPGRRRTSRGDEPARRPHRRHRRPPLARVDVRHDPDRDRRGLRHPSRRARTAAGGPRLRGHRRRRGPGRAPTTRWAAPCLMSP